jgi:RNA polymerase sigma factor (TIGR02999 family)
MDKMEATEKRPVAPSSPAPGEITQLLVDARSGRREALDRLFELVYGELRGMAHRRLRGVGAGGGWRGDATLSTTVLVHEAYLKLTRSTEMSLNDRQHFFAVAGHAMRQIVIDRARRVTSEKRGSGLAPLSLDDVQLAVEERAAELVALDTALGRLEAMDSRLAKLVELRFFAGRTLEEIAELEGRSERTLKRDWRKARAFLYRELEAGGMSQ